MLTGIANYLFGGAQDEETQTSSNNQHCDLKTRPGEDEWVLVDKARGNSSHQMASHPMEDLLIEHPSMSVYGLRGRPRSTGVESEHSESSNDGDKNKNNTASARRSRGMETRAPRRPRAVAARAGLCARVQTVRSMQKSQQRQSARLLGKNRLDRANKVREYESHSKRHQRKQRLMQPSGGNNNRRC